MAKPPRMSLRLAGASLLAAGAIAVAGGLLSRDSGSSLAPAPTPAAALTRTTSASIAGTVTDVASGAAISSAIVAIQGKSTTTTPDGRYLIADLTDGQVSLTVQHQGHRNFTQGLTLDGATAVDVVMTPALEAGVAGHWVGRWNNDTLDSSGAMAMTLSVDTMAQTMRATLHVDAPAFGTRGPRTETISGSYTTSGATLAMDKSPVFGDLQVYVSPVGRITGSAANVPGDAISRLDFAGTITVSAIRLDYAVTSTAGNVATGVATLEKR